MYRFAVITPTLNSGRYIERCIKSVANQLGGSVTHIIVDGGSTDDTLLKVQTLSMMHEVRYYSLIGSSQSSALNFGWEKLKNSCELVGWLNSDEFYSDGAFEEFQTRALETKDHWCVMYGNYNRVDEFGHVIRRNFQWKYDYQVGRLVTPIIQNSAAIFNSSCIPNPFVREDLEYVMDWDFYVRIMAHENSRALYISSFLGNFTMHDKSKTSKGIENFTKEVSQFRKEQFPMRSDKSIELLRRFFYLKMVIQLLIEGKLFEKVIFKMFRQKHFKQIFGI